MKCNRTHLISVTNLEGVDAILPEIIIYPQVTNQITLNILVVLNHSTEKTTKTFQISWHHLYESLIICLAKSEILLRYPKFRMYV